MQKVLKARLTLAALLLASAAPAMTQVAPAVPRVQTAVEALAQDAAEYARLNGVTLDEAMRRLRAQEGSVAATDRIQALHRDRLAGISVEHSPDYRIIVLLAGSEPVPDETITAPASASWRRGRAAWASTPGPASSCCSSTPRTIATGWRPSLRR